FQAVDSRAVRGRAGAAVAPARRPERPGAPPGVSCPVDLGQDNVGTSRQQTLGQGVAEGLTVCQRTADLVVDHLTAIRAAHQTAQPDLIPLYQGVGANRDLT